WPRPQATPRLATTQIEAAVVRPCTDSPDWLRRMTPAPKKPMPVITPWIVRETAPASSFGPTWTSSTESTVISAEPRATSACVRKPAGFSRSSRSTPRPAPAITAASRRRMGSRFPSRIAIGSMARFPEQSTARGAERLEIALQMLHRALVERVVVAADPAAGIDQNEAGAVEDRLRGHRPGRRRGVDRELEAVADQVVDLRALAGEEPPVLGRAHLLRVLLEHRRHVVLRIDRERNQA